MNQLPDFDPLAGLYRWMEYFSFGPWLALTRRAYLDRLGQARHALVLGDGDGRFTASLLRANPEVQVDAVDGSPAMLQALLKRAEGNVSRVRTHVADARSWKPPSSNTPYDLVATHFFLDCLTGSEIQALASGLRPYLAPSAVWVVSEFAVPKSRFGRLVARPLVYSLYAAFGILTGLKIRSLPDHAAALHFAGFERQAKKERLAGLLVGELWSVAASPGCPARGPAD